MPGFVQKGKGVLYLFITFFFLGFIASPHAREGDTVFAFNLQNLGRVFERVVQLPEPGDQDECFRPLGSDNTKHYLQVF